MVPRSLTYNVHYFKRSINGSAEAGSNLQLAGLIEADTTNHLFRFGNMSGTVAAGVKMYGEFTYQFSLEHVHNYTEFTNLFDSYRINKVVVRFIPRASSAESSGNSNSTVPAISPNIHIVKDYDDNTLPSAGETGLRQLREYSSYKVRRFLNSFAVVIRPKIQGTAYGYDNILEMNTKKMGAWINTDRNNVKHLGFKGTIEAVNPSSALNHVNFEIVTTYYMSFKGVR